MGTIEAIGGSGPVLFSSSGGVSYGTTVNMPRTLVLTGANGGVNSFGGRVSDNGSGKVMLVKSGTNTWQVTRTSGTYSGGTEIDGGTLIANGLSGQTPLGVGDVTVNSGGTLAGAMTIGGAGPDAGAAVGRERRRGAFAWEWRRGDWDDARAILDAAWRGGPDDESTGRWKCGRVFCAAGWDAESDGEFGGIADWGEPVCHRRRDGVYAEWDLFALYRGGCGVQRWSGAFDESLGGDVCGGLADERRADEF